MRVSRRQFTLGLGACALGATVAPTFARRAAAQTQAAPVRFLGLRTPHGADRDFWIPRLPGGGEPNGTDIDLNELTFEYENNSLAPMMPWRDKITVIDGLDSQVVKDVRRGGRRNLHGHNEQGTQLTGAAPPADRGGNYDNHPSLDFFLHGELLAPALLTASVEDSSTWKCMSYDAGGRPRRAEQDPMALYDAAFPAGFVPPDAPVVQLPPPDPGAGGSPAPAPGSTPIPYDVDARIAVYGEGVLLRLRERLAGREAAKIDSQLEAMARLRQVAAAQGGAIVGTTPTSPSGGDPGGTPVVVGPAGMCAPQRPTRGGNVGGFAGVVEVARAHANVIAQAFACGRARAATLEVLNDYPNYFSELPEVNLGFGQRYHESLVHTYWSGRADLLSGYTAGLRWSATHAAAVLEELDAMPDPLDPYGGSVLDNTVVFWHSEFGHGGHDNQETRQPVVIAGGGGRTLRLGRYLRVRNIQSDERVPHNLLLTSILHAMGMSHLGFFGDRDMMNNAAYQGPLLPLMA